MVKKTSTLDLIFANLTPKERNKLSVRNRNAMMRQTFGDKLSCSDVVYMALRDFSSENGYQPTQQEISQSTGYANQAVSAAMRNLINLGYCESQLTKSGNLKARTYRVTRLAPPKIVTALNLPRTMLRFIMGLEIGQSKTFYGNPTEIVRRFKDAKEHFTFKMNKRSVRVRRVV